MDFRRSELNRDIGNYISSRRKNKFKIGTFFKSAQKKDDAELHPEVRPYSHKEPMTSEQELVEPMIETDADEITEEEFDAAQEEIQAELNEHKKVGFFQRMFGNKKEEQEAEELDAFESEPDPDLKEISKITLDVLKKLDGDDLREFKESEDFARFKDILKRNNLIK